MKRMSLLCTLVLLGFSVGACTNSSESIGGTTASPSAGPVRADGQLRARVPEPIRSRGTLTVGSDTAYPPAEFFAGVDGKTPTGFDVDLARAIANTLGLRLDWQTAKFDSILPAIGPKYDLGISAFTITKERYGAVDMVSYMQAGKIWAVQKGNPKGFDPASPCGARVGIQNGSTAQKAVAELSKKCTGQGKPAVDTQLLEKQTDVVTRLVNGAITATYSGLTTLGYAVQQSNGRLETVGGLSEVDYNGIAIAKGAREWATLIADTINKLIEDGVYERILNGYGLHSALVDKASVNPEPKS